MRDRISRAPSPVLLNEPRRMTHVVQHHVYAGIYSDDHVVTDRYNGVVAHFRSDALGDVVDLREKFDRATTHTTTGRFTRVRGAEPLPAMSTLLDAKVRATLPKDHPRRLRG
jgi:hypothetical protein